MAFKMPGLLKSKAFGVGAFTEINTRYDRMAENAEKYKLAAMARGQELRNELKNTKDKLKIENQHKIYVATTYGEAVADWLDFNEVLKMGATEKLEDFYTRTEEEVKKIQSAGGVPSDFVANENMYYGEQRYQDYETQYNTWKTHSDKMNNVFGESYDLLMESQKPELATKEQFGVREREGVPSLDRQVQGEGEGVKPVEEVRLKSLVSSKGTWGEDAKWMPDGQGSYFVEPTGNFMKTKLKTANVIAGLAYRFNAERSTEGASVSAEQGVVITDMIIAKAQEPEYGADGETILPPSLESALADLDVVNEYMAGNMPLGDNGVDAAVTVTTQLYLYALQMKYGSSELIQDISRQVRQAVQAHHNIPIIPESGAGLTTNI